MKFSEVKSPSDLIQYQEQIIGELSDVIRKKDSEIAILQQKIKNLEVQINYQLRM